MKYLKTLLLFALITGFMSCGGDDGDCTTDDWVGTYTGNVDCDDGTNEEVTVVITKVDENTIRMMAQGESFDIDVNGCGFNISESINLGLGDIKVSFDADISGNNMDYSATVEFLGEKATCSGTLSK